MNKVKQYNLLKTKKSSSPSSGLIYDSIYLWLLEVVEVCPRLAAV